MVPNELRIGNWYMSVKFNIPVMCELTDFTQLDHMSDGAYNDPPIKDLFNPIPLTEEWLMKFHSGEEIEKSGRFPNEITIYDRFLFIYKSEYKYWYVITAYHKEYLTKIEFVHEYQNFILALTGEELKTK